MFTYLCSCRLEIYKDEASGIMPPVDGTQGLLSGKWVLVTGASKGLGANIAITMAKQGASLALMARSEDKLEGVSAYPRPDTVASTKPCHCTMCPDESHMMISTCQQSWQDLSGFITGPSFYSVPCSVSHKLCSRHSTCLLNVKSAASGLRK